ncbi:MAG TPA: hypothetical protein VKB88_34205 [Bryobacteraceae bacterium]|jgi:hypothetical protein|nr:hypothetical protein [Bryobacteraceae bacterium]
MSYRHFSLQCRCGQPPSRIEEVGITDDHELVIHWWCDECNKIVYASKSLEECFAAAPPMETDANFDENFLTRLGICRR